MNVFKHQECYESPDPEVDFELLNEKNASNLPQKDIPDQILTIYKTRPLENQEKDSEYETNEERLARLKAELDELKEEVDFLTEKEKVFKGGKDQELDLLREIQKFEEEMMQMAKIKGIDNILSNSFHGKANFEQNLRFIEQQKQGKVLEEIFAKIDVILYFQRFFLSFLRTFQGKMLRKSKEILWKT
jgi:hypothetical protein